MHSRVDGQGGAARFPSSGFLGLALAWTLFSLAGLVPAQAHAETPYMDAVEAEMKRVAPKLDGTVYARTSGNEAIGVGESPSTDWLLQTPECWELSDCPDQPEPASFGRFLDSIRNDLARAREQVDITTLIDYPDGRFRDAIVSGLRDTLQAGNNPTVRILGGCYPTCELGATGPTRYLRQLVSDIGTPRGIEPRIYVASFRYYTPSFVDDQFSWNHAKMVAVDGRTTIVGGHNLWTGAYLQTTNPVHDTSVRLVGPAAVASHRFAGVLWDAVCVVNEWWTRSAYLSLARSAGASARCPRPDPPSPAGTGSLDVLAMGRVGLLYQTPGLNTRGLASAAASPGPASDPSLAAPGPPRQASGGPVDPATCPALNRITTDYTNDSPRYDAANPSESGLRALVAAARSDVLIAQQDLLGPCPAAPRFDRRLLDAIVERLRAGVRVRIVTSTPGAKLSLLTPYANAKGLTDVTSAVFNRAWQLTGSRDTALALTKSNLRVAAIRFTHDVPAWPRGGRYPLIAQHSKVVQVDRRAFYVGSQNLYPAWLSDFGVLIDDETVGEQFESSLAKPLWEASCATAIWGPAEGDVASDACPNGEGPPVPDAGASGVRPVRAKLIGSRTHAVETSGRSARGATVAAARGGSRTRAREVGVRIRCIAPKRLRHCRGNVELETRGPRLNGVRVPARHLVIGTRR
jgi:phosphatidylserine/phosphatidylglycerophosphate/cardiolipin synthase-like enzyme